MEGVQCPKLKKLILKLFDIGAFKFGDFKMKSGINSPVYFDLRLIVSYPDVMISLTNIISEYIKEQKFETDHFCGVPYTALPLATLLSVREGISMLIRRKEPKSYGTKKLIEGVYKAGDKCIIIEDVVTSGSSVLETVNDLKKEGIIVTDAIVVLDREQGGSVNIKNHQIRLHSVFSLNSLLQVLYKAEKISMKTVELVKTYIELEQIKCNATKKVCQVDRTKIPFEKRVEFSKNEVAKELFNLMSRKETNLCLAADFISSKDILRAAEECGPYICILKTHVDIIEDYSEEFIDNLKTLSKQYDFFLMEDRKFADIGNTVSLQYGKGIFKISKWADLITAHIISGPSILQGLKAGLFQNSNEKRGVFLISEMSSCNNFTDSKYKEGSYNIGLEGPDTDFVTGFVCQSKDFLTQPGLIQLTPGIKMEDTYDCLGQTYQSPEFVIKEKGADIGIVGRGIIESKNLKAASIKYRDCLWAAYKDRLTK